jgi:hypothetical protein
VPTWSGCRAVYHPARETHDDIASSFALQAGGRAACLFDTDEAVEARPGRRWECRLGVYPSFGDLTHCGGRPKAMLLVSGKLHTTWLVQEAAPLRGGQFAVASRAYTVRAKNVNHYPQNECRAGGVNALTRAQLRSQWHERRRYEPIWSHPRRFSGLRNPPTTSHWTTSQPRRAAPFVSDSFRKC